MSKSKSMDLLISCRCNLNLTDEAEEKKNKFDLNMSNKIKNGFDTNVDRLNKRIEQMKRLRQCNCSDREDNTIRSVNKKASHLALSFKTYNEDFNPIDNIPDTRLSVIIPVNDTFWNEIDTKLRLSLQRKYTNTKDKESGLFRHHYWEGEEDHDNSTNKNNEFDSNFNLSWHDSNDSNDNLEQKDGNISNNNNNNGYVEDYKENVEVIVSDWECEPQEYQSQNINNNITTPNSSLQAFIELTKGSRNKKGFIKFHNNLKSSLEQKQKVKTSSYWMALGSDGDDEEYVQEKQRVNISEVKDIIYEEERDDFSNSDSK